MKATNGVLILLLFYFFTSCIHSKKTTHSNILKVYVDSSDAEFRYYDTLYTGKILFSGTIYKGDENIWSIKPDKANKLDSVFYYGRFVFLNDKSDTSCEGGLLIY